MDDLYQDFILDHYKNPRHFGQLEGEKESSEMTNLSCGDGIKVDVKLDDRGIITDVAWQGEGCAISMAAASVVSEWAVGQPLKAVKEMPIEEIVAKLGLEQISHSRMKCAYLFVHAIQKIEATDKGRSSS